MPVVHRDSTRPPTVFWRSCQTWRHNRYHNTVVAGGSQGQTAARADSSKRGSDDVAGLCACPCPASKHQHLSRAGWWGSDCVACRQELCDLSMTTAIKGDTQLQKGYCAKTLGRKHRALPGTTSCLPARAICPPASSPKRPQASSL